MTEFAAKPKRPPHRFLIAGVAATALGAGGVAGGYAWGEHNAGHSDIRSAAASKAGVVVCEVYTQRTPDLDNLTFIKTTVGTYRIHEWDDNSHGQHGRVALQGAHGSVTDAVTVGFQDNPYGVFTLNFIGTDVASAVPTGEIDRNSLRQQCGLLPLPGTSSTP